MCSSAGVSTEYILEPGPNSVVDFDDSLTNFSDDGQKEAFNNEMERYLKLLDGKEQQDKLGNSSKNQRENALLQTTSSGNSLNNL